MGVAVTCPEKSKLEMLDRGNVRSTIFEVTKLKYGDLTAIGEEYGLTRPQLQRLLKEDPQADFEYQRGMEALYDKVEGEILKGGTTPRGGVNYTAAILVLKHKRGWVEKQKVEISRDGYREVRQEDENEAEAIGLRLIVNDDTED